MRLCCASILFGCVCVVCLCCVAMLCFWVCVVFLCCASVLCVCPCSASVSCCVSVLCGSVVCLRCVSVLCVCCASVLCVPVPPQRLPHRPVPADGDHHGAEADLEQLHGAGLPVSLTPGPGPLRGATRESDPRTRSS